jgi:hypothetical protein
MGCPVPVMCAYLLREEEVCHWLVGLPAALWTPTIYIRVPQRRHQDIETVQQQPGVHQLHSIDITFQGRDQVSNPHH